jgi:hypothetical protein
VLTAKRKAILSIRAGFAHKIENKSHHTINKTINPKQFLVVLSVVVVIIEFIKTDSS